MTISVSTDTLILTSVFAYFGIGGLISFGAAYIEGAFTGKVSPMVIALFFFWPAFYLAKLAGPWLFVAGGLLAAGAMTGLAWLALRTIQ